MKKILVLFTFLAVCLGCAKVGNAPCGRDVTDLLGDCQDGTLLGYDLKWIDVSSLSEDFLATFKTRSGYDLKEIWPQMDTLKNRGKFLPYILFDYRSAVVDLWRKDYVPVNEAPAPRPEGQRLLLLYSDVDLMRACAGDDTTAVNCSEKIAARIAEKRFEYDFVSDTTVRAGLKVRGGRVLSPCGTSYDALVIPGNSEMLAATFESVLKLVKKGAAVIFETDIPLNVPGLIAKGKIEKMGEMLEKLKLEEKSGLYYGKYGRGHILVSNDIIAALVSMGMKLN